jgi:hypothetical protein
MKRLTLNKNLDLEREVVAARGPKPIKDEHIALWRRCKAWAKEGMKRITDDTEDDGIRHIEMTV